MKKMFLASSIFLFVCSTFSVDALQKVNDIRELDKNGDGCYEEGEVNPCEEYQTGPCVCSCPVTRFKPQYYCEKKCVQEPYCVQKKCTRYVPEYYTKQFCRMVPQYYTKTFCKKVPECYYVSETKYRNRYIMEKKCKYVPYTVMETCCIDEPICDLAKGGSSGSNSSGSCSSGSCSSGSYASGSRSAGGQGQQMDGQWQQYGKPSGWVNYDQQNKGFDQQQKGRDMRNQSMQNSGRNNFRQNQNQNQNQSQMQ